MAPISDVLVTTLDSSSILVTLTIQASFNLSTKFANDLVFDKPLNKIIPIHSSRLQTTGVKVLLITLKHQRVVEDARLGFYRSSIHSDSSLFATVKDYLSIEKGWFSPYLFASARRPIIPRNMKPDVVFCHGPFLSGDYRVGETLLAESASVIELCDPPPPPADDPPHEEQHKTSLTIPNLPTLSNLFSRSRTPSPTPQLLPLPPPPSPKRLLILLLGIKPHRKAWSFSLRPGESVINYLLLNGCPAIIVPAKIGAPLVAWDGLTLEMLWGVDLPKEGEDGTTGTQGRYEGIINVLCEYLDLCVEWERVKVPEEAGDAKEVLKSAVSLLVAAAIRSKESKEVKKEVDPERTGIVIWRIP